MPSLSHLEHGIVVQGGLTLSANLGHDLQRGIEICVLSHRNHLLIDNLAFAVSFVEVRAARATTTKPMHFHRSLIHTHLHIQWAHPMVLTKVVGHGGLVSVSVRTLTASTGNDPAAVSPESMTQSVPSSTATTCMCVCVCTRLSV